MTSKTREMDESIEFIELTKAFAKANRARKKMRSDICDLTGKESCRRTSITAVTNVMSEFSPTEVFKWLDIAATATSRRDGIPEEIDMIKYLYGIIKNVRGAK